MPQHILVRFGNPKPLKAPPGPFEGVDSENKGHPALVPYGDGVPVETVFHIARTQFVDAETKVAVDGGATVGEFFTAITQGGGWRNHSAAIPTWVESNDEGLEKLFASQYGCPAGAPSDMEATHLTHQGPPGTGGYTRWEHIAPEPMVVLNADQVKRFRELSHGIVDGKPVDMSEVKVNEVLTLLGIVTPVLATEKVVANAS